jgi:LDH2 family malate/lactate/ureidoglycolate dehydrogenase
MSAPGRREGECAQQEVGPGGGTDARRVAAPALERVIGALFVAAGCAPAEAGMIANGLVEANLFGHDSHGVILAPVYVRNIGLGLARPEGLLLDGQGRPTNDPRTMFQDPPGALLPFAQHKGFALAVMCEVLGGALSGGLVQDHAPSPNPMLNNMLSLVFAPDKLVRPEGLADQVARLAAWLRGSPAQAGSTGIHLPREPEQATAEQRRRDGVPLPRATRDALAACARTLDVAGFDEALAPAVA